MELPKEKIEISVTGEQTREIAATTIGRSKDKPAKALAFMGLDNAWHFFRKDDKDLLFKNPAKDEYEIILNNEKNRSDKRRLGRFQTRNRRTRKDGKIMDELIENVKAWAKERGIDKQPADAGYRKTVEELGELSSAYSRNNKEMMIDSLGDTAVCLINLATQMGLDFNECLEHAYNEIKDRKGKTVNGVFVKDADLKNGKDNQ